ncbi:MAG: Conserved hypothetical secreted protein with domain [Candidatus Saccharibacteria bacterium]|nr:Conserved hypothetical secreted protein with domain [Candidatus Saccharibacteria bacterium]
MRPRAEALPAIYNTAVALSLVTSMGGFVVSSVEAADQDQINHTTHAGVYQPEVYGGMAKPAEELAQERFALDLSRASRSGLRAPLPLPSPTDIPQMVPTPVAPPVEAPHVAPTTHPPRPHPPEVAAHPADIMSAAGIAPADFAFVDYIISHEGGWEGVAKHNKGGSGAYGICQALPGEKMASAGADWQTNPVTQLTWCNQYALGRYGSWAAAHAFWIRHNWW